MVNIKCLGIFFINIVKFLWGHINIGVQLNKDLGFPGFRVYTILETKLASSPNSKISKSIPIVADQGLAAGIWRW
jgi:hypothetical protein